MSQSTENEPKVPAPSSTEISAPELRDDELEKVTGGVAHLLPAVQKVRHAVAPPSTDGSIPTETLSLNFDKIT